MRVAKFPDELSWLRASLAELRAAMDRAIGAEWPSKFRSEGNLTLEAGSLFPVGHLPLKELLKKRLGGGTQMSPRPSSLNPTSRFLEHLGRWSGRGVGVRLELAAGASRQLFFDLAAGLF